MRPEDCGHTPYAGLQRGDADYSKNGLLTDYSHSIYIDEKNRGDERKDD